LCIRESLDAGRERERERERERKRKRERERERESRGNPPADMTTAPRSPTGGPP
jgi:hypothetical protein